MDIRRTVLWMIFSFSLLLLWNNWQIHNGKPSLFGGPTPAASTAEPQTGANATPSVPSAPTATTAATVLNNYGIVSVARKSSAGASTQLYTLAAPTRAGLEVTIYSVDAGSTRTCRVTLTAASFHSTGNSTTLTKLTFNSGLDNVRLLATSTGKWLIQGNTGSVTIA